MIFFSFQNKIFNFFNLILQGNPGRWNHPCCQEIISKFLFENTTSLGHKFTARFGPPLTTELVAFGHTMVNLYFAFSLLLTIYCFQSYICLQEWVTGTLVSKDLNVVDNETKYNSIFEGMKVAENDSYAGPLLRSMYSEWWDQLM